MDGENLAHEQIAAVRSAKMLAVIALLVALTGPLWVPALWGTLNFRSAADVMADQNHRDVARLEQALSAADQRAKAAEAAVAGLKADLGRVEQRTTAMREALTGGAAAELSAGLRADSGFAKELNALRAFIAPPPDVAEMLTGIAPFAETGVPTARTLRNQFIGQAQGASEGTMAWLRRAITFSPDAPAQAMDPNMLEAETLLRDDDLVGAMAAVRRIEARPAWLEDWLKQAAARSSVDALLPRLDRLAGTR